MIWESFTNILTQLITLMTMELGVSSAIAIILFTLLFRFILSPLKSKMLIDNYQKRKKLNKLKPELETLKERYKDDASTTISKTQELYKKHDIKLINKDSMILTIVQSVLGLGMFSVIQKQTFAGKFAWIENVLNPDVILSFIVTLSLSILMILSFDSVSDINVWLVAIPTVMTFVFLISSPSILGIYFGINNIVSIAEYHFANKKIKRMNI
jgi:YidC/Oxa1 family membrane protein insertase